MFNLWSLASKSPSSLTHSVHFLSTIAFFNPKIIDEREPRISGPLNAIRNMWGSLPDSGQLQGRHLSLLFLSLIPDAFLEYRWHISNLELTKTKHPVSLHSFTGRLWALHFHSHHAPRKENCDLSVKRWFLSLSMPWRLTEWLYQWLLIRKNHTGLVGGEEKPSSGFKPHIWHPSPGVNIVTQSS